VSYPVAGTRLVQGVSIIGLSAMNVLAHRTAGGSPCATANELAWYFQDQVAHEEMPEVLLTDDDERARVPPLTWHVSWQWVEVGTGPVERLAATITYDTSASI
jgi:hypothetical protein